MSKEAMKLALELFEQFGRDSRLKYEHQAIYKTIVALKEALANHIPNDTKMVSGVKDSLTTQQEQGEPVAWMYPDALCDRNCLYLCTKGFTQFPECATTPQQRTWVAMTEEDFVCVNQLCKTPLQAAAYTEQLLKEKNV